MTWVKVPDGQPRYKHSMADVRQTIRQRIEHYRRMLADGVPSDLARVYLEQIARDHAKLRELGDELQPDAEPPPSR